MDKAGCGCDSAPVGERSALPRAPQGRAATRSSAQGGHGSVRAPAAPTRPRPGGLRVIGPLDPAYDRVPGLGGRQRAALEGRFGEERPFPAKPATVPRVDLVELLACLRAQGVRPHPEDEAVDADVIASIEALVAPTTEATPEATAPPADFLGMAHGEYPRTAPASPDTTFDTCSTHLDAFQGFSQAKVGSSVQMVGGVAHGGFGRVRRLQQCDLLWGAVAPVDECSSDFFHYGQAFPAPTELQSMLRAEAYRRFSATTLVLVTALHQGVKVDLGIFNGGGGMQLNLARQDAAGVTGDVPLDESRVDSGIAWENVLNGAPDWQDGVLLVSGREWAGDYWTTDANNSYYDRVAVNVWPTSADEDAGDWSGPSSTSTDAAGRRENARRKCLGIAAYAWIVGEWLRRVDDALRACGHALSDVVGVCDVANELDQYWALPASPDVPDDTSLRGAREAGRYLALLAGPIRAQVPEMRFRAELTSWFHFRLDFVVGEVGIPAADPGEPPVGKDGKSKSDQWTFYYAGMTDVLQGALLVRVALTLYSAGVSQVQAYTFKEAEKLVKGGWPEVNVSTWSWYFLSQGVRNDLMWSADGKPQYTRDEDCWARPSWYALRRLRWLVAQTGSGPMRRRVSLVHEEGGLTVVRLNFPSGLTEGPDGTLLAERWHYLYVAWLDQETATDAYRVLSFAPGSEAPTYEQLALVPSVARPEPGDPAGNDGYALSTPTWDGPGWDGGARFAVDTAWPSSGPGWPQYSLRVLVWRGNPEGGTALVPVAFFCNAAFEGA